MTHDLNVVAPAPFASAAGLGDVQRLLFDLDDTLTWQGQVPEVALRALYQAEAAGYQLIAVTGRSFAWAEMLMRWFPLAGAVAETGGLALWRTPAGRLEVLHHEPDVQIRQAHAARRSEAAALVLAHVVEGRLALDNVGRVYDTAYDLAEEGPVVSAHAASEMRTLLHAQGLVTAQSSVHINAWCVGPHGPFDKATMVDRLLQHIAGIGLDQAAATLCYVGDSKNDGAMFARAGYSVGVRNVAPHLAWLHRQGMAPRYIVDADGGHGFADVVAHLLAARAL